MEFRTLLKPKTLLPIKASEHLFFCGSCFSVNIGQRLQRLKVPTYINSHGILFNPLAITRALSEALEGKVRSARDLEEHNGVHFSLDFHSELASEDASHALKRMNASVGEAGTALRRSKVAFITLGTAYAYYHLPKQQYVANCHKLPSHQFRKELLSVEQTTESLQLAIDRLKLEHPVLSWVFTVSPVRHVKDGIVENTRSKAVLLNAVHQLVDRNDNCHYFPAYELMIDDLRDYRFYGKDLLHPNELGLEYVWSFFKQSFYDSEQSAHLSRIERLLNRFEHQLRFPGSEEAQRFKSTLIADLLKAEQELGVSFKQELASLRA